MTKKSKGSLDKKKNKGGDGRLSKKAIQERLRTHSVMFLEELVLLAQLPIGANDNVKLGAIKTGLAKIAPDLKSQELVDEDGKAYRILLDLPGVIMKPDDNKKSKV